MNGTVGKTDDMKTGAESSKQTC